MDRFFLTSAGRATTVAVLTVLLLAGAPPTGRAQESATLSLLHSFNGGSDSTEPSTLIRGNDGNFYGTTFGNTNNNDYGSVFEITPAGAFTTIHTFTNGNDGADPEAALVQGSDGNFYGTTAFGGANQLGTIFEITPEGGLTTLYAFTGGGDGSQPRSTLVKGSDGNFYGTAYTGGTYNRGTVFRFTPAGLLTVLHTFAGTGDGDYPEHGLIQGSDGNFYGTTAAGGGAHDGTVYQMTPAGALTTLYTFGGSDGQFPSTALVQGSDGSFYGTTGGGGANGVGTVFRITSAGSFATIHSFDGTDGADPEAALVQGSDGNFYGTTGAGETSGYTGPFQGQGTVFRMTPAGVLTTLHSFTGDDGEYPHTALVQGSDGNFYGTTSNGGDYGYYGTVFKLALGAATDHAAFFTGEAALNDGVYYLSFPNGNPFGYYSYLSDQNYIYHFDLGYEYVFDAADGYNGVYLYDFASNDFFYTSPGFPFPYLYDFGLNSVVYYYPDPNNPGHYNTDGVRYFYVFNTGQIISK